MATKVRGRTGPGPNQVGLSRAHILASIDASLKRLGLDHVDLYQIHGFDPAARRRARARLDPMSASTSASESVPSERLAAHPPPVVLARKHSCWALPHAADAATSTVRKQRGHAPEIRSVVAMTGSAPSCSEARRGPSGATANRACPSDGAMLMR